MDNKKYSIFIYPTILVVLLLLSAGAWGLVESLRKGPAVWSLTQYAPWGFPVANFVFWIGVAHAGTFISAILLLFRVPGRERISHVAELTTLCAWVVAGLYPVLHLGRPWLFHWVAPLPSVPWLWPQPGSPLFWDLMAISAYGIISFAFFLLSLLPSQKPRTALATLRLVLAALLAPTVVLVHTVVSFDFAVTQVWVWHTALLPFFFVVGALTSGIALVVLALPLASWVGASHSALVRSGTRFLAPYLAGCALALGFCQLQLPHSPPWPVILMSALLPQLLWSPWKRRLWLVRAISGGVLLSLAWERLHLVGEGLRYGTYLRPVSPWHPTLADGAITLGGLGLFLALFLLVASRVSLRPRPLQNAPVMASKARLSLAAYMLVSMALGLLGFWALLHWWPYQNLPLQIGAWNAMPWFFTSPAQLALALLAAALGALVWWWRSQAVSSSSSGESLAPWLGTLAGAAVGALLGFWLATPSHLWPERKAQWAPSDREIPVAVSRLADTTAVQRSSSEIFRGHCAICHGADGASTGRPAWLPVATALVGPFANGRPDSLWRSVITDGKRLMPSFSGRLDAEEIDSMIVYLRAMGNK